MKNYPVRKRNYRVRKSFYPVWRTNFPVQKNDDIKNISTFHFSVTRTSNKKSENLVPERNSSRVGFRIISFDKNKKLQQFSHHKR